MGLDLASSALSYYFYSLLLAVFFIGIPVLIFKLQNKDIHYEIRHRLIPNETLYRNQHWGFRVADFGLGMTIGFVFYEFGDFLWISIKNFIIKLKGIEYYQTAAEGSVNTTPPPPPPNPWIIWTLIISGIIIQFLIVAVSEEFCFRGVLLKEFNHIHPALGIFISSGLFMLYHVFPGVVPIETFVTFWLYYFSFGVLLAIITIFKKQDLIVAIVAHGTFNSIMWVARYLSYL